MRCIYHGRQQDAVVMLLVRRSSKGAFHCRKLELRRSHCHIIRFCHTAHLRLEGNVSEASSRSPLDRRTVNRENLSSMTWWNHARLDYKRFRSRLYADSPHPFNLLSRHPFPLWLRRAALLREKLPDVTPPWIAIGPRNCHGFSLLNTREPFTGSGSMPAALPCATKFSDL